MCLWIESQYRALISSYHHDRGHLFAQMIEPWHEETCTRIDFTWYTRCSKNLKFNLYKTWINLTQNNATYKTIRLEFCEYSTSKSLNLKLW